MIEEKTLNLGRKNSRKLHIKTKYSRLSNSVVEGASIQGDYLLAFFFQAYLGASNHFDVQLRSGVTLYKKNT